MNANGQRLLELAATCGYGATSTCFQASEKRKVTWQNSRSKRWHQLHHILVRRRDLKNALNTRTMQIADYDSDHSLVVGRIHLPARRHFTRFASRGPSRINFTKCANLKCIAEFKKLLLETAPQVDVNNTVDNKWNILKKSIKDASLSAFGRLDRKQPNWFAEFVQELRPLVEHKRHARLEYSARLTRARLNELPEAKRALQREARNKYKKYVTDLSCKIQIASNIDDIRAMYEGIKRVIGPQPKKCAPIAAKDGTALTSKDEQLGRLIEHLSELYGHTPVFDNVFQSLPAFETKDEIAAEPTLGDVKCAIAALRGGKSPGEDEIPSEILKAGGEVLVSQLADYSLSAGAQKQSQMKCVMLFSSLSIRTKGSRSDCNNYRAIALLSVVGKVFARVLLSRLKVLAEDVYPESQCGLQANRSTSDVIFSLRLLKEKCAQKNLPLHIAFVDLPRLLTL